MGRGGRTERQKSPLEELLDAAPRLASRNRSQPSPYEEGDVVLWRPASPIASGPHYAGLQGPFRCTVVSLHDKTVVVAIHDERDQPDRRNLRPIALEEISPASTTEDEWHVGDMAMVSGVAPGPVRARITEIRSGTAVMHAEDENGGAEDWGRYLGTVKLSDLALCED